EGGYGSRGDGEGSPPSRIIVPPPRSHVTDKRNTKNRNIHEEIIIPYCTVPGYRYITGHSTG
ncbi:MAG TPA: hypothetical protein PKJ71_09695, partial [Bacteroidales bacterium]|nr:hypothetical protein [Bacteroidales bacterium]